MAVGAGAIKAGQGFMELFLKSDKLDSALKAKAKQIGKFSLGLGGIGAGLAASSGAILAPLLLMAKSAAAMGDELRDMAMRTGASTNALSELGFAAEQSGGNIHFIEDAIKKMQRALRGNNAEKMLGGIKLKLSDLQGLSPDKQFEMIGDAISKLGTASQRTDAYLDIFGRSGTRLAPLFEKGAEGLRAMRAEAVLLGLSISQEQADAADEYGDAWNRLSRSWTAIKNVIGAALIPMLTEVFGSLKEWIQVVLQVVKNNKELVVTIFKFVAVGTIVGTVLALMGTAGLLFTGIVAGIGTAFGVVAAVAGVVGPILAAAFAALLSPVGLVIAGIVLLVAAFFTLTETGRNVAAVIVAVFMNMLRWVGAVIGGIFAAIMKGNWALAGQILITALAVVWLTGINTLLGMWVSLKYGVLQIMDDLGVSLQKMWSKMWVNLSKGWGKITDQLAVEMVAVRGMVDPTFDADAAIKSIRDARKEKNKGSDVDTKSIDEAAASRRKQRKDKATDEMAPYEAERKRAQAELDALIAKAKQKNELSSDQRYPGYKDFSKKKPLLELTSGASVGTFSGFAARRLGQAAPGINEKILAANELTNDKLDTLIEQGRDGGGGAEFGT